MIDTTSLYKVLDKDAQRYFDEGAAAVFVDHVDYDNEKDRSIPYVKIYW